MSEPGPLTVEDRLDIMELLVRYTWSMDERDAEGFASVFVLDEDADVIVDYALNIIR